MENGAELDFIWLVERGEDGEGRGMFRLSSSSTQRKAKQRIGGGGTYFTPQRYVSKDEQGTNEGGGEEVIPDKYVPIKHYS